MISASYLSVIKEDLQRNDITRIKEILHTCEAEISLRIMKEQKILFVIKDEALRNELIYYYKDAINRILTSDLLERETLYADFALLMSKKYLELDLAFQQAISNWASRRHLKEILILANVLLESEQKKLIESYFKFLEQKTKEQNDSNKSELNAFAMHMFNARNNDLSFALSNLINTAAKYCSIDSKDFIGLVGDKEVEYFHHLVSTSSELVSHQWVIDKVSYGEWYVAKIANNDKPEITFDVADIKLELSRELGIRGDIISIHLGKKQKRWLHSLLEGAAIRFMDDALDYYQGSGRLLLYSSRQYSDLKTLINQSLDMLDAEDELLVGLNQKNQFVIAHYLFAVSLMCFSRVAGFCRINMAKKHEKDFICHSIPLKRIETTLKTYSDVAEVNFEEVFSNLITTPPAFQHFDIIGKPYIRIGEDVIGLSAFTNGNWPSTVRAVLYKGGEVGNVVGKSWEGYLAYTFEGYGWKNVGSGIKLAKGLPDIDVVVMKREVLLLLQVKSIYGTGISTFEQWKFKEKILKGAEQALKAHESLRSNKLLLSKWLRNDEIDSIKIIQPLVVTNSPIFNGWAHSGIPIISTSSLMQMLRGAKVDYVTLDKRKISSQAYASGNELNTQEFLDFLTNPLDWRIANEKCEVEHEKGEVNNIVFHIPKLKRADGLRLTDVVPIAN